MKRIVIQILTKIKTNEEKDSDDTILNRAKFYEFVNKIDDRSGSNFLETFPEMKEFYNLCRSMRSSDLIREVNHG